MLNDEFYMHRCLQLALSGSGHVAPNPMVGSVLVFRDQIIGEGFHKEFGQAHAEVNCLQSVAKNDRHLIPDSTLYVSLEPCSHYGKTPPCADMIIRERIRSVRIGCIDINQQVHGQGVQRLKDAGINVVTGICERECVDLNKRFFTFHTLRRPYIILKWARSQNDQIGQNGKRLQISNTYTNLLVHSWRRDEAAILVGSGTARVDDPLLTNRYGSGHNPLRIILAGERPPQNLKMFQQPGKTIVFNTRWQIESEHVDYIRVPEQNFLQTILRKLFDMGIQSLLVEGGAYTHQQFLNAGLWDECRIITNTKMFIPDGVQAASLPKVLPAQKQILQDDVIDVLYNPENEFVLR